MKNAGIATPEEYKALEAAQTTEATFQRSLVLTARDYHFRLVYHTKFSLGSDPGFPDLVLVNDTGRCVVVECKRVGKEPTARQRDWLEALGKVPGIETYHWTPADWNAIHEVLGRDWLKKEATDGH